MLYAYIIYFLCAIPVKLFIFKENKGKRKRKLAIVFYLPRMSIYKS